MQEETKEIIKCKGCKKKFFLDGFKVSRLGVRCSTCLECAVRRKAIVERNKCDHGRQRVTCRDCGGACICEHGRHRNRCKDCGGINSHLLCVVNTRICDTIGKKAHKTKTTHEFIGCDIQTYRAHIEAQFKEGMIWTNHSRTGWHIDHIIPLKAPGANGEGPTIEEVIERLHYTNTQPLWALENLMKGCKIE